MTAAVVAIAVEPPDSAAARACLRVYFAELAERFEGGFDPGKGGAAADLAMAEPTGRFLIARIDGQPVGCGGLKRIGPGIGEIKRMWVDRQARGLGIARRLLDALEAEAGRMQLHRIRLDTNGALGEAQAMYRKAGYVEIDRYNDNPYAQVFFEKVLNAESDRR